MSEKRLDWKKVGWGSRVIRWYSEIGSVEYGVLQNQDGTFEAYAYCDGLGASVLTKDANNFTEAATECEIHAFGTAKDIDHLTAFANIMTKFAALSDEDKASALEEIEKLLHV